MNKKPSLDQLISFGDITGLSSSQALILMEKIASFTTIDRFTSLWRFTAHSSKTVRRNLAKILMHIASARHIAKIREWLEMEDDETVEEEVKRLLDWVDRQDILIDELFIDLGLDQKDDQEEMEEEEEKVSAHISVGQALKITRSSLADIGFIVIEGELIEPKSFKNGSMFFFGLKDNEDLRLDCRIITGAYQGREMPLNEGLLVRAGGSLVLSNKGKLLFQPIWLEEVGEGELARSLKELEQRLAKEGLFDESRKRSPIKLPQNVLLVASSSSAAIEDYRKVLRGRRGDITIYHLPILTQGSGAESDILNKLALVNDLCDQYAIDTIVITRGGGSKDDLAVFNSEKVARAVYSLNRPVIAAIGHEQDLCISEMVADRRASTPSNAAEMTTMSASEIKSQLDYYISSMLRSSQASLNSYRNKAIFYSDASLTKVRERVYGLKSETFALVENIKSVYSESKTDFLNQLSSLMAGISHSDPRHILESGYAIIEQNNKRVTSVKSVNRAQSLRIIMKDGQIEVDKLQ
jgi:exodeoxyribonuclease VII large subunit